MRLLLTLSLILVSALGGGAHAWANNYNRGQSSASAAAAARKDNCQGLLDNKSFSCNVKSSFGTEFTDCFQFFSPGTVSVNFDLVVIGFDPFLHMGCACGARKKFENPDFNASKTFVCDTGDGFNFGGKASGNGSTIKNGFVEDQFGDSFVFECTLSPISCGASPSGAFIDAP